VQSNVAQTLLSVLLLRSRCARAHLSCRNAARSVRACTPVVSQRCAVGARVHTCRVATLRHRCARAHLPCRNAARSVRACTPAVSQCCAVGAHVHACMSQCCAPDAQVRARGVAVLHLRVFALRLLTPRLSLPIFLATTSRIARFSMLAAVGGMGVLDST